MRLVRDAEVRARLHPVAAAAAVAEAFAEAGEGSAALQPRARILAGPTKLSTMAAILPGAGIAGAKVYTTIGGRFRFVVLLFDAAGGAPLACIEADSFTEIRTAAVSEVAAAALARADATKLAVFGAGVQAAAHARAFGLRWPLREIAVVSRSDASAFCARLAAETGVTTRQRHAPAALDGAGLVVTATRATEPLFEAGALASDAFVAAVGATLPAARELPTEAFACAGRVVVEDEGQSFAEAGDLIAALAGGDLRRDEVETLAVALRRPGPPEGGPTIFKSVGVALADVAVAGAVWRALGG